MCASLSGYHKCSREEAARLAALIYRVRHGENKQELQSVPQLLRELVPADLIKAHSSSEWKRSIVAAYNQDAGMAEIEAAWSFEMFWLPCFNGLMSRSWSPDRNTT